MRPVRIALLIAALGAAQAQAGVFDDEEARLGLGGGGGAGRHVSSVRVFAGRVLGTAWVP